MSQTPSLDLVTITHNQETIKVPIDVLSSWLEARFGLPPASVLGLKLPNGTEVDITSPFQISTYLTLSARHLLVGQETVLVLRRALGSNPLNRKDVGILKTENLVFVPYRGYWMTGPNTTLSVHSVNTTASQGYCCALNVAVADFRISRIPNVCYVIKLLVTDWNRNHGDFIEADVGLCVPNDICPPGRWCTSHTKFSQRMMVWNHSGKFPLIGPFEVMEIHVNFQQNVIKFNHKSSLLKECSFCEDEFVLTLTLWSQGSVRIVH
eukprot:TRINITY_DN8341_c0_g1_i1.p1 TRINITY_DN8341_c0_g1~~TRINITY_DN8341_c0_g1_i1.p1  ORF type:complete len:265 (-),score=17.31 TRINITY_DN8341_c0_g1_i1:100-894(-)